mgnify:CR=1 FL=1
MRHWLIAAVLLLSSLVVRADGGALGEALTEARAKGVPVLLDFHAPWCYSCYFMKKNVLTGPEWARVERETVVLDLDADSPEGAAIKEQYAVKALPSYVVINAAGEELGRINAERTRAQFYPELAAILKRNTTFDDLRNTAALGGEKARSAARSVLASYLARNESQAGLDWFAGLPAPVLENLRKDASLQRSLARLQLNAAARAKQPEACLAAAEKALAGKLDCESPYDLDTALGCTQPEASDHRRGFLAVQAPRFEQLLTGRVLARKQGCADARSAVFALADLYEMQGNAAARAKTLQKGIAYFSPKIASSVKVDRNAADNLRVFHEAAGDSARLDALLEKLVIAYPADYVYASRYARVLAGRGAHESALPWFARAADKAYGINRLRNAQLRVQSLLTLKRTDEARQVAAEALKANGPWFPDEMAKLKSLLANN